jgi:hypothetical protein
MPMLVTPIIPQSGNLSRTRITAIPIPEFSSLHSMAYRHVVVITSQCCCFCKTIATAIVIKNLSILFFYYPLFFV